MRLLDGFSRAGVVRLTGVLVAAVAVAACCVGVSSAAAAEVIRTIRVGLYPDAVSSDGTHVWVANSGEHTVSEIEASSGAVIRTIEVGLFPRGVSSDGTHVWVANQGYSPTGTVSEIEASSGAVIRTIPVGDEPYGVSSDGTHVWVTNYTEDTVSEIEASSGSVIRTIPVGGGGGGNAWGVSSDGTHVWVANWAAFTVSEIDASSGTVIRSIPVFGFPSGVSSDGTHVWVGSVAEDGVSEIEASSGTVVRAIPVGKKAVEVSSDGAHVWVTNLEEDTVSEITTGPEVSIEAPASGGTYLQGTAVRTKFSCTEGEDGPGLESCTDSTGGSGTSGVLETSTLGPHTYTVTAKSKDGKSGTATISYTVVTQPTCTGNSGTVKLSPGLTDTAAVQTMKIKGTLTGCAGTPFTGAKYTATLTTAGPVSCSVLSTAGEPATGAAKYVWTPKTKASKGTLSTLLTETPDIAFSSEVTTGSYAPLTLTGFATESYTGGPTCGEKVTFKPVKAVKNGTFSQPAVSE